MARHTHAIDQNLVTLASGSDWPIKRDEAVERAKNGEGVYLMRDNGEVILYHPTWRGMGYDTFVYSPPTTENLDKGLPCYSWKASGRA